MPARSPLDEARFGFTTGRATVSAVERPGEILAWSRTEGCQLLIVRCDTSDYQAVHAIESAGGILCDTLAYFEVSLDRTAAPSTPPTDLNIRPAEPKDADAVEAVARAAFRGYLGHYHTDPRLESSRADDVYADWARRSCGGELAERVLVAERSNTIVGFLTLRRNTPEEAEIVLNAVDPSAQRAGVYGALVERALGWAREVGSRSLIVSTQVNNVAPQKAWVRLGFQPLRSIYTFHLWSP